MKPLNVHERLDKQKIGRVLAGYERKRKKLKNVSSYIQTGN